MKILTLFLTLAFSTSLAIAQDTTVTIPVSQLTKEQRAAMTMTQTQARVQQYGEWVGVGKEVGEAVNSSLSAISDNAAKFADTRLGKVAMMVVVWKVVGDNILDIIFTLIMVFVATPVLVWSYKKNLSNVALEKEVMNDVGKVVSREYRELTYNENEVRSVTLWIHACAALIILISTMVALF